MTPKKIAVFGIFHTEDQAERSVDDLLQSGFASDDVSVLLPDSRSTRNFAHEKNTKAPEGATAGAAAGGAVGGTLGLLVGIGVFAIPGLGPLLVAGPIISALAGVGAGGTMGGLIGALVGMGIPEYEAKRYEGQIKAGGVLLSVHCDTEEQITRAKELLKQTGGQDIASTDEATSAVPVAVKASSHR